MSDVFLPTIRRAQQGDDEAMAEIFDAFFDTIFRYTIKRVDSRQTAEDIVSAVFLEVVQGIKKFQGRSSVSSWIYSITKNKIADFWRQQYKQPTIPLEDFLLHEKPIDGQEFDQDEKQYKRFHNKVHKLLTTLKTGPRKLLELRFLQGYTLDEAAIELNMTKNTAKVTQFRALKKLRNMAAEGDMTT